MYNEPPNIPPAEAPLRINTDIPLKQKIRKAILQLKNGKAPGPGRIPPEAIKADIETSVDCPYRLFGKILVEEKIPEDWRYGPPVQAPQERQFERLQKLEGHHVTVNMEGHHVTVNTMKSVQQDSYGNNENRG